MLSIALQLVVAILSPAGICLLAGGRRRLAAVVGLLGQAGYMLLFVCSGQYILLLPTLVYTAIWVDILRKKR